MTARRPNVLFFFTDDQRFDTIAALGNRQIITPNIDRLVERGVTFTHAHIPCGTVGAVCMPSRAMLHTGRTLFHIDGAGERIPEEHTTLGEAFRRAGYQTFGTGKWHNGRESYQRSFSDGDEVFFGGMADHWNVPAYHFDPTGRYDAVCLMTPDFQRSNATVERHCDHIHAGRHSSRLVCDAALEFLKRQTGERPFMAYVSFLAPHDPRTMPQKFLDLYDPQRIDLPPNIMGRHPFDNGALNVRDEHLAAFPRTPEEIRRHVADYYAMITHLDCELGRVMETLEQRGLLEETIIVFAGDNGLALGQHGLMGKQNCYEHSVRVPLIFAGPGIPCGERTHAYAYLLDVFPTLCELCGVAVPSSVEGRCLVPAMHDPAASVRDSLYFAYADVQRAVKDRRHKLVEYAVGGAHTMTQLFDLEVDPWELQNLADDAGHADTLATLRTEMKRLRDEWEDPRSAWGKTFWDVCQA